MLEYYIGLAEEEIDFIYPLSKKTSSLEYYALGSDDIGNTTTDKDLYYYKGFIDKDESGNVSFFIDREQKVEQDDSITPSKLTKVFMFKTFKNMIGDNPIISEMSWCFDINMQIIAVIKINGMWYLYNYVTNKYELQPLRANMKSPCIGVNGYKLIDIYKSKIIIVYINNNHELCYAYQETGFAEEHKLIGNMKYGHIGKIGVTTDNNFGILIRK